MTDPLEAAAEALKNHPTLKLKYKSLEQRKEIVRVVVDQAALSVAPAIERLRRAVEAERTDTLGSIGFARPDNIACVGSGSWSGNNPVTWGELAAIVDLFAATRPKPDPSTPTSTYHPTSIDDLGKDAVNG